MSEADANRRVLPLPRAAGLEEPAEPEPPSAATAPAEAETTATTSEAWRSPASCSTWWAARRTA